MVLLFAAEASLLGFLSLMLALLLFALLRLQLLNANLLILVAGGFGLGSLWWMLLAFGLPGGPRRSGIPWIVRAGLGVGALLAVYLVARVVLEGRAALDLQAALLFGAPMAICVHLLARSRRRPVE